MCIADKCCATKNPQMKYDISVAYRACIKEYENITIYLCIKCCLNDLN